MERPIRLRSLMRSAPAFYQSNTLRAISSVMLEFSWRTVLTIEGYVQQNQKLSENPEIRIQPGVSYLLMMRYHG